MSEIGILDVKLAATSACERTGSSIYLGLHLLNVSNGHYENNYPLLKVEDVLHDPFDSVAVVTQAIEVLGCTRVKPHPAIGLLGIDVLKLCGSKHAGPRYERVVSLVLAAAGAEPQFAGFRHTHFGVGIYPADAPFGTHPLEPVANMITSPEEMQNHQISSCIEVGPFWQSPSTQSKPVRGYAALRSFETIVPAQEIEHLRVLLA